MPDITGDGAGELLISGAGRPAIGSLGERRVHLINGATGQRIQSFESPISGDSFAAQITSILDRTGKLRAIVAGAGAAGLNRSGRAHAFPLSISFLSSSNSIEGLRFSLTTTDEENYEVQASPNLQDWTVLTTVKAAAKPALFLDNTTHKIGNRFYRAKRAASTTASPLVPAPAKF